MLTGVTSGGITGVPAALPPGWRLVKGYLVGPAANLKNANLLGANLAGANLAGALLTNTRLANANLRTRTSWARSSRMPTCKPPI